MTITPYLKEAFSEGLSDAIRFYMVNRLIEKHAQVFRNDCCQGEWSSKPRDQWPNLLDRTEQYNVALNFPVIAKLTTLLDNVLVLSTWECKRDDYDPVRGPNSMVTPCIAIEAGRLTEANRRLGRQCGAAIYIPFYVR